MRERKFIALFLFGVAMAFVEAAAVVYLREVYYPSGFLAVEIIPLRIYSVEVVREAATIIMLASVAYLSFTNLKHRFFAFLWIFAIWDIFYYVFLKIILNWPESLATSDVLFLLPFPWVAPVWFPLLFWSIMFIVSSSYFSRIKKGISKGRTLANEYK